VVRAAVFLSISLLPQGRLPAEQYPDIAERDKGTVGRSYENESHRVPVEISFVRHGRTEEGKRYPLDYIGVSHFVFHFESGRGTDKLVFDIPMEYARDFIKAEATDPADVLAMQHEVQEEFKKELAERLLVWWLPQSQGKAMHRDLYGDITEGNLKVRSISITGQTSPEALAGDKKSILPDHADPQNIQLGKRRAAFAGDALKEALKNLNFNAGQIDEAEMKVDSTENQFTEIDRASLLEISRRLGIKTKDENEAIWETIVRVNKADMESDMDETLRQAYQILAAKRQVHVEINFTGNVVPESTDIVLPMPGFALLISNWIAGRMHRRRKRKEASEI
jgi:hypothetical protein